jgi:hypothetical protein
MALLFRPEWKTLKDEGFFNRDYGASFTGYPRKAPSFRVGI